MKEMIKKNYEQFESVKKMEEKGNDYDEEDDDEDEAPKKHDFKFIKQLRTNFGRPGSDVVAAFAHHIFTERDTKLLTKYFVPYFD